MLLVLLGSFSASVISQIESIGGGRAGRGWAGKWGRVRIQRRINAPIRIQRTVLCFQYVTYIN